jgi:nucleoside transporter
MSWPLYLILSAMMFLEYAIWGAWMPVLVMRLLGPLGFNGKQTGWIYATLPLACIVSPLLAGQMADQWIATQWILAGAHLIGAVLLLLAARTEKFKPLLAWMLLYSCCYAGTLPLVNSLMFAHLSDPSSQSTGIFIWAPIAWSLIGYLLTGWRWIFHTEKQGSDCLYLAAALSLLMGLICLFLPNTPPKGATDGGLPIVQAFAMLKDTTFLFFLLVSMVVAGLMQFYFLGTAQFLIDHGVPSKNASASMAIAQAAQAIATWYALGPLLLCAAFGFKGTLLLGAGCWAMMYGIYAVGRPRWLMVACQSLHGLAYVFFIVAGQIFANSIATADNQGSVQALVFAATTGVGMFLGTHLAGTVMDAFSIDGKFQWPKIWLVPAVVTLIGWIALAIGF